MNTPNKHLVLLGDSIIDNGVYVGPKQLSVAEQIELAVRQDGYRVTKLARDGDVVADVYSTTEPTVYRRQFHQIAELDSPPTRLVLSAGGNDILQISDILRREVRDVQDALRLLHNEAVAFSGRYAECLDRLKDLKVPLWVFTIYDPCFRYEDRETLDDSSAKGRPQDPDRFRNAISHTAISIFNSEIFLQANRRGIPVLDIRTVFTDPADYANPIEPSAQGGAKLADKVAQTVLAFDRGGRKQ